MNRILSTLWFLVAVVVTVWGVPADPRPFRLQLHDGTEVMVRTVGDESFHYIVTLDGTPVVKTAQGYELQPQKKQELRDTYLRRAKERNMPLLKEMSHRLAKLRRPANGHKKELERPDESKFKGKKDVLVLLVEFPNCKFSEKNKDLWYRQLNEVGYTGNGCTGSVHDYFYDNSCGQFDLHFDVVGPVMMNQEYQYYGQNDSMGNDELMHLMVQEACGKVNVDWMKYDNDFDGVVDPICLVYAGFPESSYSSTHPEYIWPQRGTMEWYPDGNYMIRDYSITSELLEDGLFSDKIAAIGTFCHEFTHTFGLHDLYDVDYAEYGLAYGMGDWDIMASGSYNGKDRNGGCPAGFSAFERWYLGWMDFDVLENSSKVSLPPIGKDNDPHALAIYKDSNKDEFVLLENRQNTKWYKYVNEFTNIHGLLAYRVNISDEVIEACWNKNSINRSNEYQEIAIIPANNYFGQISSDNTKYLVDKNILQGHLFPYGSLYLDATSHAEHHGKWLEPDQNENYDFWWSIDGISELSNGNVSFTFASNRKKEGERFDNDGYHLPQDLSELRYWVDEDTVAHTISPKKNFKFDAQKLDMGMHTLYCQILNKDGYPSEIYRKTFYKLPDTSGQIYDYWFDNDKISKSMTTDDKTLLLDAKRLSPGFHTLYIRQRNNTYDSDVTVAMFYRSPDNGDLLRVVTMVDGEFANLSWVPSDGTATPFRVYAGGLETGFHLAQFVVLNDEGGVTDVKESYFYKLPSTNRQHHYNLIYSIDGDEEKTASIVDNAEELVFYIDVKELKAGDHTLAYKLMDSDGYLFDEGESTFEIIADGVTEIVLDDDSNLPAYDLSGRPVRNGAKGIRIVGGKKILKK